MIELLLVSLTSLWGADNREFLERTSLNDWEYVGYTERDKGQQRDGSYALTASVDGNSYILFKQRSPVIQSNDQHFSE
jgi:hypothetical protein